MWSLITLFFFIAALLLFGSGMRLIIAPLEDLWVSHARKQAAQGLAPQRSMAWERGIYLRGALRVTLAIICLAVFFLALLNALKAANRLPKFSNAIARERKLA